MSKTEDLKYEILTEEINDYDLIFKLIVVGDSGVGKSCLTMRGTKNCFEECYSPTVGFEFCTFCIKINGQYIKLQIWDTCGQEIYKSLITSFYRNASLAILVYSIDNQNSFNNIETWLNEIKSQSNPEIKIFLIGNKADLEDDRNITFETAEQFSKEHSFNYFIETSAKTGLNAQNVFIQAAKELYLLNYEYNHRLSKIRLVSHDKNQKDINMNVNNILLNDEDNRPSKRKKCC